MAQIIIISIIILYVLWAVSFLIIWIQSNHLAKMINTLEQAVDYSLLKTELYLLLLREGEDGLKKKESKIRSEMDQLKHRIHKDFDV